MKQSSKVLKKFWDSGTRSLGGVRDSKTDWFTILLFIIIVVLGWLNLYSTSQSEDPSILNFSTFHGKEAIFILISVALGIFILFLDTKFVEVVSYIAYALSILALFAVLGMSKVSGASSWFAIGGIKIQPTEFAKVATLMALAKYMSRHNFSMVRRSDFAIVAGILTLPMLLVIGQNDAGSALVFMGIGLMFYREGMNPLIVGGILLVGVVGVISILTSTMPGSGMYIAITLSIIATIIGVIFFLLKRYLMIAVTAGVLASVIVIPFVVHNFVQKHHSARIRVLIASDDQIREDKELNKVYYNLRESLVAIGSGSLWGKGYGNGTHTRGDFVPEEHTDYIFCVVGEEHGFLGTSAILIFFLLLILRIIYLAENSKTRYARVFGYGAASVIFVHVVINVGMTIGLLPTVGIPLPFFSYGGSSMIAFTLMVFIAMNLYSYRMNILT